MSKIVINYFLNTAMIKRTILFVLTFILTLTAFSQNYYWVFFTDKNDTEFNPYDYFDDKAIERRHNNNISLYDISDYPLNTLYCSEVANLSDDVIGETRWFNAMAIETDAIRAEQISNFLFVKKLVPINSQMYVSSYNNKSLSFDEFYDNQDTLKLSPQLVRMGGDDFKKNNIDGKGIRIAVFDGGFPGVDTHEAFKHLRDNNQILKTYNFPKKKEDVYGWNSHGTMVLSCIAGIKDDAKIGLATGSEFLLARTEVGPEPAKEEVYWMMAVEWADKNGANVINSSLGYGATRYNISDMDGKTSLVTRAANMAASKGILVCNAMGNEGSDKSWKTLGAPADADSILSIGGIEPYKNTHINFSSYGPTQDGRTKPNVCAFGTATVASPKGGFTEADGTSFASPLVAGFVACAWQTKPDLDAMQMKAEIEKSGDFYPYFDYALGYGVPQAAYFVGNNNHPKRLPTFIIKDEGSYVQIWPALKSDDEKKFVSFHIENPDGLLEYYTQVEFWIGSDKKIEIDKIALSGNNTLRVFCDGYIETYKLSDEDNLKYDKQGEDFYYESLVVAKGHKLKYEKEVKNDKTSGFGTNAKFIIMPYLSKTFSIPPYSNNYTVHNGKSGSFSYGLRYIRNFTKVYRLGLNFEFGRSKYKVSNFSYAVATPSLYANVDEYILLREFNIELFQRLRILPPSMLGFGLNWDTGIYGSYTYGKYVNNEIEKIGGQTVEEKISLNGNDFNWGVRSRISYGILGIYGKYRISDIELDGTLESPRLEIGLDLAIPLSM